MIRAGVDVVRMNFSHGTADDHLARAELVRDLCRKTERTVGIMADLQGPKIRVGKFKDGRVTLETGDRFVLDAACELGDQTRVGLDYKELPQDVKPGDVLLLDDGKIVFDVEQVGRHARSTRPVRHGGVLSNNKGINRLGRRPDRARAHREGHGGHPHGGGASRPTSWPVSFPKSGATCTWRAS